MYYLIEKWKIVGSSSQYIEWYINFSQEQLEKLNSWYVYIDWEIVEWPEVQEFEKIKQLQEIEKIKQKYSSIILAKYSLTDQLNMSNEALMINTSANIEQRAFTEKELARFWEIKQAKVWIDEQRELCQKEIWELIKSL